MTGYASNDHVFPVTIGVMRLFGHVVKEKLEETAKFADLLGQIPEEQWTSERKDRARALKTLPPDLDAVPFEIIQKE